MTARAQVMGAAGGAGSSALPTAVAPPAAAAGGGGRGGTQVGAYAGDLGTQRVDLFVQEIDMGQLQRQQLPMMVADQSGQGLLQEGDLAAHPPMGQLGHRGRVGLSLDQGRQDRPPRHAHDVRGHRGQLDVGPFQHPLHPVDLAAAFLHHLGAVARQIAQVALRHRRDEAGLQQAMAHQFGQPARIGLIRLAPRHLLDVGRVDQEDGEVAFQDVVDRFPVLTRAFHGHMRDACLGQPVGQGQQVVVIVPNSCSSMTPSACCPVGSGVTRHAITVFLCTSNPAQWVKITSMGHLHVRRGWRGYPDVKSLQCVLCFHREAGDNPWCLRVSGSNCCTGSRHQLKTDLAASPMGRILHRLPRPGSPLTIFMPHGALRGMITGVSKK